LKQRIRDMVLDGASDAEIASFLTARYGHSILYRPPLKPSTWALWAGPFVLLAIGGLVFARVVGARAEDADAQDEDAVSRSSRSATR
jgi:cytochrome c-type biogenesis protein CcmH